MEVTRVGLGFTVIEIEFPPAHTLGKVPEMPPTLYVVVLLGVTVITGVRAPVLHEYDVAALAAVSVTVCPEHTELELAVMIIDN
jgi:hypothetical protein